MNTEQHTSVSSPGVKIVTAWLAAIGVGSWSDFAAALAALYSLLLISEWVWRRCLRPLAERHGIVASRKRRAADKE